MSQLSSSKERSRAVCIFARLDRLTNVLAHDGEFQQMIGSDGVVINRAGRISFVNEHKEVVLDVFTYYHKQNGISITLPPSELKLGVYSDDLEPGSGAIPIGEAELVVREVIEGRTIVGHSIANDINVFTQGLFHGIKIRDTQLHEPYREYSKTRYRMPKLSMLTKEVLGRDIQGVEHSSVEDAQATMDLYLKERQAIELAQHDWVVRPDSDWGQLGLKGIYGDESDIEPHKPEQTPPNAVEITRNTKSSQLPVTAAAQFWKKGMSTLKKSLCSASSKSIATKPFHALQMPNKTFDPTELQAQSMYSRTPSFMSRSSSMSSSSSPTSWSSGSAFTSLNSAASSTTNLSALATEFVPSTAIKKTPSHLQRQTSFEDAIVKSPLSPVPVKHIEVLEVVSKPVLEIDVTDGEKAIVNIPLTPTAANQHTASDPALETKAITSTNIMETIATMNETKSWADMVSGPGKQESEAPRSKAIFKIKKKGAAL